MERTKQKSAKTGIPICFVFFWAGHIAFGRKIPVTREVAVALFVRKGAEQFSQNDLKREKTNRHQMPRKVEVRGVPGCDSAVSTFFFPVCAKDRPSLAEPGKL